MNNRDAQRDARPADEGNLIEVRSLDDIPAFANEEAEVRWWETHELSDQLWAAGEHVGDPLLPPVREGAPRPQD
jgi:hypothetical protein